MRVPLEGCDEPRRLRTRFWMGAGVAANIVFLGGVRMAEVVLFHSVLGLRPGVIAAGDRLRVAGHKVHTPDLYDGEVFDDLDDG